MWVDVIRCRCEGLRLKKSEWPAPVRGMLCIEELPAEANSFKRAVRVAMLVLPVGVSQIPTGVLLPLFEPTLLPAPRGRLLIRGIELTPARTDDGAGCIFEHEQLWLCTQAPEPE